MLSDILSFLNELNLGKRVGVVGSFARGDYTSTSDIDVFVDTNLLTIEEIELIKNGLKNRFSRESDVICSELAREEDEEMDKLLKEMDLPVNNDSSYKNMLKEVVWCE